MSATLPIERRALGRSELTVPRVALGCGNFGGVGSAPELFGQGLSQDEAFELMDAAWEQGLNHFDTADAYGGGRSERMIGAWMRSRGVRPMLTTKTYNPMDAGADHGLVPERIARQLESSLERLGVDQVDLYLAHEFDPDVPLPDTLAAFERLAAEGKIRAYGVSNFSAAQLDVALEVGSPQAIQNEYSLLARGRRGRGAAAVRARAGLLPRVQPARGGLADRQVPPRRALPGGIADDAAPRSIRARSSPGPRSIDSSSSSGWRGRAEMSMAGLALAWLLADERVTQIVVGPGRPEHLAPVREAIERPLSGDERATLDSVFR